MTANESAAVAAASEGESLVDLLARLGITVRPAAHAHEWTFDFGSISDIEKLVNLLTDHADLELLGRALDFWHWGMKDPGFDGRPMAFRLWLPDDDWQAFEEFAAGILADALTPVRDPGVYVRLNVCERKGRRYAELSLDSWGDRRTMAPLVTMADAQGALEAWRANPLPLFINALHVHFDPSFVEALGTVLGSFATPPPVALFTINSSHAWRRPFRALGCKLTNDHRRALSHVAPTR